MSVTIASLKAFGRPVHHAAFRAQLLARCWCSDLVSRRGGPGLPLPPALLRYRTSESLSKDLFLRVGQGCAAHIENQVRTLGGYLASARRILDFGCGCGRILRWLVDRYPNAEFYGADVDSDAIDWCARHIAGGRFVSTRPQPPLPYPKGHFDLVYCISVFTHLDERMQDMWLLELRRVLRPEGILLLTVHGERAANGCLNAEGLKTLRTEGLVHRTTRKLSGIVPEWYNTTWHSQQYIVGRLRSLFTDVRYTVVPESMQDIVLANGETVST